MKQFNYNTLGILILGLSLITPAKAFSFDYLPSIDTIKSMAAGTVAFAKNNSKPLLVGTGIVAAAATGTALYIYKRNQDLNKKALENVVKMEKYQNLLPVYKQVKSVSYAEKCTVFAQVAASERKTFNGYWDEFTDSVFNVYMSQKALPQSYTSTHKALKLALDKFEPLYDIINHITMNTNTLNYIQRIETQYEHFKALKAPSLEEQKMIVRQAVLKLPRKSAYIFAHYDKDIEFYLEEIHMGKGLKLEPDTQKLVAQLTDNLGALRAIVHSLEEYKDEARNYKEDKRRDRELRIHEQEMLYHRTRMYELRNRMTDLGFYLALDYMRPSRYNVIVL